MHALLFDGARNDVLAEIVKFIIEQAKEDIPIEHVNAHGGEEQLAVILDFEPVIPIASELEFVLDGRVFGLLDEADDAMRFIDLHDAKTRNVLPWNRQSCDCDFSAIVNVLGNEAAQVHAIQLISAEDQHVIKRVVLKMNQVLPYRVGRPLVTGGIRQRLLRRQYLHEAG